MNQRKAVKKLILRTGKWAIVLLLLSVLFLQQSVFAAAGEITGIVFNDYNADGAKGTYEQGIEGVIVTAYDAAGNSAMVTTTATGNYTIASGAGLPSALGDDVRVEYTLPSSLGYLQPGAAGDTTVQFANISSNVSLNVGFNNPAKYCQANPQLATSVFTIGDPENAAASGQDAVVESAYLSGSTLPDYTNGTNTVPAGASPRNPGVIGLGESGNAAQAGTNSKITNALIGDVGPVSGLAFERESNTLLAASYMKRFAGFPDDTGAGSPGRPNDRAVGTIYAIDRSVSPNVATEFYYASSGTDTHDYTTAYLGANQGNAGDTLAREDVGFKAWGDIDLTEDGSLLYGLNYFDQSIHMITVNETGSTLVAGGASVITIPANISNQCNGAASNNRNWQLGGAKTTHDSFYFGITCTAFTSQAISDLHSYIYSIPLGDATPTFTLVADAKLNYPRVQITGSEGDTRWKPWVANYQLNNSYHQPHLTDIEFDELGNMIVGMTDRSSEQAGAWTSGFQYFFQAGELLRLTPDGDGTFSFEYLLTNLSAVPGDEFFKDTGNHQEMSYGEVAVVYGTGELVNSSQNGNLLGGLMYYNSATGVRNRFYGYTQAPRGDVVIGQGFGKANAIGDVEPLCNPAPIELGNRVWKDTDGDGVQDPGEDPLVGVTLNLYRDDGGGTYTLVGTAVTNSNGQYIFNGGTVTQNGATGVERNTTYVIRIDNITPISNAGLTHLSPSNQGGKNTIDTDGVISDVMGTSIMRPEIVVTTGGSGQNDHTFDFGFNVVPTAVNLQSFSANNSAANSVGLVIVFSLILAAGSFIIIRRRKVTE